MTKTFCIVAVVLSLGCAHATRICDWNDAGQLSRQYVTSTVVGTGDTEIAAIGCEAFGYSTKDTGFSDNATVLIPDVAGKVAGAIVAGSGIGAAGSAIDLLKKVDAKETK